MARAAESTHWYTVTGQPAYTVKARDGSDRPTTLRDARKMNLLPSVTTIIRCASAPGLVNWQIDQGILSALTLPRAADELEADWLDRVKDDAKESARKAAAHGELIHAAIQGHFEGTPPEPELWGRVQAARDEIYKHCGERRWIPERSFAHPLGYAGKSDLHSLCATWLLDVKTKDFSADSLPDRTWDEHAMQLAAYRRGLGVPTARCGILYVSRTCDLAVMLEVSEETLAAGLVMFDALLHYWMAKNRYRPTWPDDRKAA